jgi:hypothetical protein
MWLGRTGPPTHNSIDAAEPPTRIRKLKLLLELALLVYTYICRVILSSFPFQGTNADGLARPVRVTSIIRPSR